MYKVSLKLFSFALKKPLYIYIWLSKLHLILSDEEGKKLVHINYNIEQSDATENSQKNINSDPSSTELLIPSPLRLECPSPEVKQQLAFIDIQAQVKAKLPLRIIIDREAFAKQGDNALGSVLSSVCPFVCPFVCVCLFEPFDLGPWFLAWGLTLT